MINLAGKEDCDHHIADELLRAGIDTIEVPKSEGEVPFSIEGRLGHPESGLGFIRLWRAWYYWVAVGNIPLSVAKVLYDHPEGKKTVRVDGHCACPAPEAPWIKWINAETGQEMMAQADYEAQCKKYSDITKDDALWTILYEDMPKKYQIVPAPELHGGVQCVTCYHIDSQAGLLLYAQEVTKLNEKLIVHKDGAIIPV
jgi:hypothetical protein